MCNQKKDPIVTYESVQTLIQCIYGLAILYAAVAAGMLEGGCH